MSQQNATLARRASRALVPLLWLGPAIVLIAVVVLWPVVVMFRTSFQKISPDGFDLGSAGRKNFTDLFNEPALTGVLVRTVIWVLVVVAVTVVISLGLAQLFNQHFPGRRVARWALIAPWASSVLMTALIFRWALDDTSGVINVFLHDIGVVHKLGSDAGRLAGPPGRRDGLDDARRRVRLGAVHDVRADGRPADDPARGDRGGQGRRRRRRGGDTSRSRCPCCVRPSSWPR